MKKGWDDEAPYKKAEEEMKMSKKWISFVLAMLMMFTVSLAMAKTVEPEDPETERLAGKTVSATVGEYDDIWRAFRVSVYEKDRFDEDDIEALAAGDILLANGRPYTVKEMTKAPYGELMAVTEDGSEIVFEKEDDEYIARFTDDDRLCMHAIAVLLLPPAAGIVYEDNTDPDLDAQMKVVEGLEAILKAKAEKEETSIGFDFYATTVTLNEKLEIVRIHQNFDVAQ